MPSSFADFIADWYHLTTAVNVNADSLESQVGTNAELESVTANAKQLSVRQAALKADLTQTTKDLHAAMATGRDLSTRLRNGIRSEFGNRSEKLLEFKIRPVRTRSRVAARPPQGPEAGGETTPPPATE